MTQTFEPGQAVYLPDGREAEYVLANGKDHLVRIIHEVEGNGYDDPPYSYPSDKITATGQIYASAPVEIWDKQVLAKRMEISALDRELGLKRKEIADAGKVKVEMEKAAAKYPCIQQALDFIEGRITHVVVHGYGGAEIKTLKEAFEQEDTWGGRRKFEGMKLLNLFGTDERGRNVAWGLNQYRDGSGSLKYQIDPARSEGHAMQIVTKLLVEAVETWRDGGRPEISIADTLKKNPWLTPPDDWTAHIEAKQAEQRAAKIEKLRAELAELEGEA